MEVNISLDALVQPSVYTTALDYSEVKGFLISSATVIDLRGIRRLKNRKRFK
jgi:hypothetical protein